MSVSYGGDSIVFADGSVNSSGFIGHRNRIINGAMVIDQRNAGAATTNTISGYVVDRWQVVQSPTTGKVVGQQNAGAVTPPVGFNNYFGITSQSAFSIVAGSIYTFIQAIEGFNFADMAWGTANAKTITLSFQVYSSLTGTFGGSLGNGSSFNRSYPFTYTISSANTWTTISITIAGDTTGTWAGATNGIGVYVNFGLGVGSTYSGTAGAWAAADYRSATGATSVVGTNGATFYITGVQLERGSTASSFEYRSYGAELALCQRYYEKSYAIGTTAGTVAGTNSMQGIRGNGMFISKVMYKVTKRATPGTVSIYSSTTGTAARVNNAQTGSDEVASVNDSGDGGFQAQGTTSSLQDTYRYHWISDAEL